MRTAITYEGQLQMEINGLEIQNENLLARHLEQGARLLDIEQVIATHPGSPALSKITKILMRK